MAPCVHVASGSVEQAQCILIATGPMADQPVVPGGPKPEPMGMGLCNECLAAVLAVFRVVSGKAAQIAAAKATILREAKGEEPS